MLRNGRTTAAVLSVVLLGGCSQFDRSVSQGWERSRLPGKSRVSAKPNILPETYFAAGELFEAQGLLGKAITQYRKAVAVNHKFAAAHHRLGVLLGKIGRHDEAADVLRQATKFNSEDAVLRNNLGFELVLLERWDEAVGEFRRAIELNPQFARAHVNLGLTLSQLDRFDEALAAFQRALPEADSYYNLGLMLRGKRRYEAAAAAFRRTLEIAPAFSAADKQLAEMAPFLEPMAGPVKTAEANQTKESAATPVSASPRSAPGAVVTPRRPTHAATVHVDTAAPPRREKEMPPVPAVNAEAQAESVHAAHKNGIENPFEYPAPPGYGLWFELNTAAPGPEVAGGAGGPIPFRRDAASRIPSDPRTGRATPGEHAAGAGAPQSDYYEHVVDLTAPPGRPVDGARTAAAYDTARAPRITWSDRTRRDVGPRDLAHSIAPKPARGRRPALDELEGDLAHIRQEIDCWTNVIAEHSPPKDTRAAERSEREIAFVPVSDNEPAYYTPVPPSAYPCPGPFQYSGEVVPGRTPDRAGGGSVPNASRPTLSATVARSAAESSADLSHDRRGDDDSGSARPGAYSAGARTAAQLVDEWDDQFGNVEDLFSVVRNEFECWETLETRQRGGVESGGPDSQAAPISPLSVFGWEDDPFSDPAR